MAIFILMASISIMTDEAKRLRLIEHWQQEDTEEMLKIWRVNNTEEWSASTIEIIGIVLKERGVELPPQREHVPKTPFNDFEDVGDMIHLGKPMTINGQPITWQRVLAGILGIACIPLAIYFAERYGILGAGFFGFVGVFLMYAWNPNQWYKDTKE